MKIITLNVSKTNAANVPKGTLVTFGSGKNVVYALQTYDGTLVDLTNGDTWTQADFDVEIAPKDTKITLIQE